MHIDHKLNCLKKISSALAFFRLFNYGYNTLTHPSLHLIVVVQTFSCFFSSTLYARERGCWIEIMNEWFSICLGSIYWGFIVNGSHFYLVHDFHDFPWQKVAFPWTDFSLTFYYQVSHFPWFSLIHDTECKLFSNKFWFSPTIVFCVYD